MAVRAVSQKLAGLARNSCPLCGELARLRWWNVFPAQRPVPFRCSSCNGWLIIAWRTQAAGVIGALTGLAGTAYLLLSIRAAPSVIAVVALASATFVCSGLMGWLALGLEPAPKNLQPEP
jgi:hypothetical protein